MTLGAVLCVTDTGAVRRVVKRYMCSFFCRCEVYRVAKYVKNAINGVISVVVVAVGLHYLRRRRLVILKQKTRKNVSQSLLFFWTCTIIFLVADIIL